MDLLGGSARFFFSPTACDFPPLDPSPHTLSSKLLSPFPFPLLVGPSFACLLSLGYFLVPRRLDPLRFLTLTPQLFFPHLPLFFFVLLLLSSQKNSRFFDFSLLGTTSHACIGDGGNRRPGSLVPLIPLLVCRSCFLVFGSLVKFFF